MPGWPTVELLETIGRKLCTDDQRGPESRRTVLPLSVENL